MLILKVELRIAFTIEFQLNRKKKSHCDSQAPKWSPRILSPCMYDWYHPLPH